MFHKKPPNLVNVTTVPSDCAKSRQSKPSRKQPRSFWMDGYLGLSAILLSLCLPISAADADLLGVYLLDGDAIDISGNGNDGTMIGSPAAFFAGGAVDDAGYLSFDGSSQYINVPLDINPSTHPQLTIGAWARIPSGTSPAIRQIISHDNGSWDRGIGTDVRGDLDGSGDTTYRWTGFTGSGMFGNTTPVAGTEDTWVFMAAVYDQSANSTTLYVDDASFSGRHAFGSGFSTLRIGSNPGFGEFWRGDIDNVFLFDEALSRERIGLIRERGIGGIFLPELPCDFNVDGICDIVDLDDLLYTGIANNDLAFDIDGSGAVNLDDRDEWLSQVDSFPGDANLDGKVDASDLNDLALKWQGNASSFANGDFDGDGLVNATDLNTLALKWRAGTMAAPGAEAVPEPSAVLLLVLAATAVFARRRWQFERQSTA